ncbi:MAG: hypothetical protein QOG87_1187 [Actinomycetota bacterium]|jgi:uncharacterized protein (TIGR03083 family)
MPKPDVWPTIHGERRALAADLSSLSEAQWETPSLCEGWTVRDVLAHMTGTAKVSGATFLPKIIGSGFSLSKMQNKDIAAERGASPAETLANFTAEIDSTKSPPGPKDTWLGEAIVHSEDIRRPLGITRQYPTDAAVRVADFYKGSNLVIGAKKRIDGLQLRATDADWSHGEGPEVAGPIVSLVMVMAGRKAHLAELSGDGVSALSSRA